ncbi:MAG: Uma2 family endonuclease [Planctomycetaceae bacterium]|nr:MAG: Uma2 family endonuclease [Planctomycetaceae bacterium]
MLTHTGITTANELWQMPPDGRRYELVQGELRQMAPAGNEHGQLTVRITWRLAQHVETNRLGVVFAAETGFLISSAPDTVRAPDLAFVSQKRIEEVGQAEGYWPGAPDLVVEVISPNDRYTDVEEKTTDWLAAGTRMVLIVNPRKRIVTVYRSLHEITILTADDTLSGDDVVPGWQVAVGDIFG